MKPGEAFERRCYEYLKHLYSTDKISFEHEGGMDSTKSDIAVLKNGIIDFYSLIEYSAFFIILVLITILLFFCMNTWKDLHP